jgi:hypothetical protein
MDNNEKKKNLEEAIRILESDLTDKYGPILGGDDLRKCLGYPSMMALRQAISRGMVPITVFTPKNRRGKFALTKDVARWLVEERDRAEKGE